MTASERDIGDHRQRILEHQEAQRKRQEASPQRGDPQLKIPLIGEIRRPEAAPPKRARQRVKKPSQPQLRDV
jgi:hypothetical protein